ncbi:glycosyl transferase family 4 [Candidatus Woesearchaeota archaeon]|nr:glycosyl transferase family 4 [Candidatus Woesearchaeota archaeon]
MPTIFTIFSMLISFFSTLIVLPYWIKRAKEHGLVGRDIHKHNGKEVAELGGLIVVFSAILGILAYIAFSVFVYKSTSQMLYLMSATTSIFIALIIGLFDDILGWKIGLRQYQKMLLTFCIALPIMAVNIGTNNMQVPFLGLTNFGILFPLIIIPLGIVGASNVFNMLAGFNGLEAGMSFIILFSLGIMSFILGEHSAAIISGCFILASLAFLIYNWYPAVVFPGDVFTLSVGATIAIVAVLGNIELYALIMFLPLYFLEFILKARGKFKKESFGMITKEGIQLRYEKFYGLTHVSIWLNKKLFGRASEKGVVLTILFVQFLISSGTVIYFLAIHYGYILNPLI